MVKEVPLSQGLVALVDDEDYEAVMQYKWFAHKGKNAHTYYALRNRKKSDGDGPRGQIRMHRFIVGPLIENDVDHWDGNGLNNCRKNLRECSHQRNLQNRQGNVVSTSTFRGVCWNSQREKWQAQIKHNGKNHQLGLYEKPEHAAHAYDDAASVLFGEFARLNFPQAA